ncbi:hypothetical protein AVEN_182410-1 [Araneus ventricosus]|uniref:Uncharacterized protein n=1 Tax=Araneus ventricosus TaxID=182803 RepID=A0A4Y2T0L4_ARAVE|nr:hypothetical protein AVEN_182410-1 [Araneus ventricosus]
MEKQLNFVLKLSLEEMALRRVVVNLWTENDIFCAIQNFRDRNKQEYFIGIKSNELWKTVEDKLTNEERDVSLLIGVNAVISESRDWRFGPYAFQQEKFADTLLYLLSLMNHEQQMQVLKKHPGKILSCFLHWPWQDLFLDFADLIWTFLPESDYKNLTDNIYENIRHADYYFPNLIQEFFLRSPSDFRMNFVLSLCSLLLTLSNYEDETIEIFFTNIDPEYKASLAFNYRFLSFLVELIKKDKCHLAELCVREASLNKEEKEGLKEGIEYKMALLKPSFRTGTLKRVLEILDETETGAPDK